MGRDEDVVKHVYHGHDFYSLMVFLDEGRWLWFVTHTDNTPGLTSHWGKLVRQGKSSSREGAWRQAEVSLEEHQKTA